MFHTNQEVRCSGLGCGEGGECGECGEGGEGGEGGEDEEEMDPLKTRWTEAKDPKTGRMYYYHKGAALPRSPI